MSHPVGSMELVEAIPFEQAPSTRFAAAARTIAESCRQQGLTTVSFRSPPGVSNLDRTIRRTRNGATIAVRIRSRPFEAVLSDMIEGVVFANGLDVQRSREVRSVLWELALLDHSVTLAA